MRSDGIDDDIAYVSISINLGTDDVVVMGNIDIQLAESNSELLLLASTSYGESSERLNNADEMSAISSAIMNNSAVQGFTSISQTIDGFALAAGDGNARVTQFNESAPSDRNGTPMQSAIAGAINAILGGEDLSNG